MGSKAKVSAPSPITIRRSLPPRTVLRVWVEAGGRCEYRGCNQYLLEHPVTHHKGNFAEIAHIVAFKKRGPRGFDPERPNDPNALGNLILLCASCHTLIDRQPKEHPRELLEVFKREHEERIRLVTGFDRSRRTVVVQLKARIGGAAVEIDFADVLTALPDRWPSDRQGHVIDLTNLENESDTFFSAAREQIQREVQRIYAPGLDAERVEHVSLFALAPIPLLVFLGSCLSSKIPVDLYQRHRDSEDWKWKDGGEPVRYQISVRQKGSDPKKVAIVLPLSGPIADERLPRFLQDGFSIYELGLKDRAPSTDFLRQRDDYLRFEESYRMLLAKIVGDHPRAPEIHLFPAVPAPLAVCCGRQLLPKAEPPLVVYDFLAREGTFIQRVRTG